MAGAEGGEPPVDQAGVSERKDMVSGQLVSAERYSYIYSLDIPRLPQVDLAVKFLTNPRVQDSPMAQKRAFLEKKGQLTALHACSTSIWASLPPPRTDGK